MAETSFHSLGITSHGDANKLSRAGYHSPEAILAVSEEALAAIVTPETLAQIREASGLTRLQLDRDQIVALRAAGYVTAAHVRKASDDDLLAIDGIGDKTLEAIREALGE